jgi:hypothetical protein
MSAEDRSTVADVRRELWTQGFVGLAAGTVSGFVAHTAASIGVRRNWFKLKLNSNTGMLAVLLGGAMGSFIAASTAGKNEVHKMHPVFRKGQKTNVGSADNSGNNSDVVDDYRNAPTADHPSSGGNGGSMYQQSLQRAKDREMDLQVLERRRSNRAMTTNTTTEPVPAAKEDQGLADRQRNRLYRRATMDRSMEAGHGGLSDAHGGHWYKDDDSGNKGGSEGK